MTIDEGGSSYGQPQIFLDVCKIKNDDAEFFAKHTKTPKALTHKFFFDPQLIFIWLM